MPDPTPEHASSPGAAVLHEPALVNPTGMVHLEGWVPLTTLCGATIRGEMTPDVAECLVCIELARQEQRAHA